MYISLKFTDSKLTLRGIAKDIASGAITIEDVEKNYQVPAKTPCSEESDGAARKSKREKNFLLRRRNASKLWQLLHQSQLNRQPRKKE